MRRGFIVAKSRLFVSDSPSCRSATRRAGVPYSPLAPEYDSPARRITTRQRQERIIRRRAGSRARAGTTGGETGGTTARKVCERLTSSFHLLPAVVVATAALTRILSS